MFGKHLMAQMKQWKAAGEEIILFADLNENIYTGKLAKQLSEELGLNDVVESSTGTKSPASHFRGKVPITGCFSTPDIVCLNSFVSPHGGGVGDHHFHVHDFCAKSMLGLDYPKTVKPSGRPLRCEVERTVKKYNTVLKQLLVRHRAFDKLERLQNDYSHLSAAEFQLLFNKWDKEVTQLMLLSESKCNKFKDGTIEFSPVVGLWLNRLRMYRYIQRFKAGMVTDPRNLF